MKKIFLLMTILVIFFTSCSMDTQPDFYTATLDMVLGNVNTSSISRAAIPFSKIEDGITFENGSMIDYPEVGQTTSWVVEAQANDVYKITVTTIYSYSDYITDTVEVYYVKDIDGDGEYTIVDPIWNPNTNTIENKYREQFRTTFENGDERDEIITTINDSFTFPADYNMSLTYSSIVEYEQSYFEFSAKKIRLTGTRYYGEHAAGSKIVIFEEGIANNLELDNTLKGKTTIKGTIVIDINIDGVKTVSGEYIFTTKKGVIYTYEIDNNGIVK